LTEEQLNARISNNVHAKDFRDFARLRSEMHEEELESEARSYIWMAEYGWVAGRRTFELERDIAVAEYERRGQMHVAEAIRERFRQ
jgi:hypothetical protein